MLCSRNPSAASDRVRYRSKSTDNAPAGMTTRCEVLGSGLASPNRSVRAEFAVLEKKEVSQKTRANTSYRFDVSHSRWRGCASCEKYSPGQYSLERVQNRHTAWHPCLNLHPHGDLSNASKMQMGKLIFLPVGSSFFWTNSNSALDVFDVKNIGGEKQIIGGLVVN